MFECRLNQFLVEILQEYNAALGLNNPPPTAQLLNAIATFVKQNTVKDINLSFNGESNVLTAKATYNDNRFAETTVDLSSLKYTLDVYDLAEKLEGSESIVVDIDETNSKIEFHIDAEILSKINRALLLPISAPTEFELVGIGNDGEQVRVKLGEGVEYDDLTKTIKASGGGGTKLYAHMIGFGVLYLVSTRSEKYSQSDMIGILDDQDITGKGVVSMYVNNCRYLVLSTTVTDYDGVGLAYYVVNSQILSQQVYFSQDTLDNQYYISEM